MGSEVITALKIAILGYVLLIISLFAFSALTEIFVKLMRKIDERDSQKEQPQEDQ
ncbi:hypothetical protein [Fervidobacterium thailandense]|uniref:hypothetical protein n=1 Tax=Fervidobacterium thailandense TaxID=1008305 RepID=UPI00130161FD|nr:hypothetical protein [Fervidobacterium thailandense]